MSNTKSSNVPRPLRVLCCSGSLEGGGSERQLWQLASLLDRREFSPSIFLLYRRGHYLKQLPDDVSVTAFWDSYDERKSYWPGEIRRLQIAQLTKVLHEQKIDVIYDRTFHMTLITAAAAKRAGVPRVSVIVSPPSSDFQKSRERFRFFKKRLLSKAYQQSNSVTIAVSEEVADDAAAFYQLKRERLIVLPNPVNAEAIRQQAGCASIPVNCHESLKSESLKCESSHRVAVIGRLSHEKGQRLALQALKIANAGQTLPIAMDVVGDGPDRAELEQLTAELGVTQQVAFHGFLPNPYPLMQAADLLCIPSEHEGLPNVALEAMSLGTSVVATDCSGSLRTILGAGSSAATRSNQPNSPRICRGERGLLVPLGDAHSMAEAFRSLATEPETWERRRTAAADWVQSHHALEPWLVKMGEILNNRR